CSLSRDFRMNQKSHIVAEGIWIRSDFELVGYCFVDSASCWSRVNYNTRRAITEECSTLIEALVNCVNCIIDIAVRRNATNSRSLHTAQHIVCQVEQILHCCGTTQVCDNILVNLERSTRCDDTSRAKRQRGQYSRTTVQSQVQAQRDCLSYQHIVDMATCHVCTEAKIQYAAISCCQWTGWLGTTRHYAIQLNHT